MYSWNYSWNHGAIAAKKHCVAVEYYSMLSNFEQKAIGTLVTCLGSGPTSAQ